MLLCCMPHQLTIQLAGGIFAQETGQEPSQVAIPHRAAAYSRCSPLCLLIDCAQVTSCGNSGADVGQPIAASAGVPPEAARPFADASKEGTHTAAVRSASEVSAAPSVEAKVDAVVQVPNTVTAV